jgi:hypothetical protein
VDDHFERTLAGWVGKLLSCGDQISLINSVIISLLMAMLSFFEIAKEIRKRLDFFRSRSWWKSDGHKKIHILTKCNIICRTKKIKVVLLSRCEDLKQK